MEWINYAIIGLLNVWIIVMSVLWSKIYRNQQKELHELQKEVAKLYGVIPKTVIIEEGYGVRHVYSGDYLFSIPITTVSFIPKKTKALSADEIYNGVKGYDFSNLQIVSEENLKVNHRYYRVTEGNVEFKITYYYIGAPIEEVKEEKKTSKPRAKKKDVEDIEKKIDLARQGLYEEKVIDIDKTDIGTRKVG